MRAYASLTAPDDIFFEAISMELHTNDKASVVYWCNISIADVQTAYPGSTPMMEDELMAE